MERREKNLDGKGKLRPRKVAAGKDLWQDDPRSGAGNGQCVKKSDIEFSIPCGPLYSQPGRGNQGASEGN